MRKFEQDYINEVAMDIYTEGMKQFHNGMVRSGFDRLDKCQAWVLHTDDYVLLKSYNTIVAVFEKSTGTLADVLRVVYVYTPTSAKHIAKFRHILPLREEFRARR